VPNACPHLDMRCWQRRGVKLGVKAQGAPSRPGTTGEGKAGRANNREPSMMPRQRRPRTMGEAPGCRDFAAGMRQAAAGHHSPAVWVPPSPGYRGRPPRPYLMRVQRDNPVGARHLVTGAGKPTVRDAQSPSGLRMAKKLMPAAERRRETGAYPWLAPPPAVPHNRSGTGVGARPERVPTWPGGPVGNDDDRRHPNQWACWTPRRCRGERT
jgi:hypothetical protein